MKRSSVQNKEPLPMPRFADRLQEGERLLWEGRPDLRRFIQPKAAAIWILSLPLIPLLVLLGVWKTGGGLSMTSPVSWAIGVGAWAFGSWINTGQTRSQARVAAYAVTNRRIFIRRLERLTSQDWRPRIDEILLGTVQPRLRPLGGDFGTITLGAPIWNYERALRGIPDAAAVSALLTEAQAALPLPDTAGQVSGPYYAQTKPQARFETAWKLEDMLRRGEAILWQGTMDAAADWRSGLWAVPMIAIVLAAVGGLVLYEFGIWTWTWQALMFAVSLAIVVPIALADSRSTTGKPHYALTSRRVLVVKNAARKNPTTEERELPETANMRLVRGKHGFGTVVFEKKTRFVWHGQSGTVETYEFSFKHIANAEAVLAQIAAARHNYFPASAPQPTVSASVVPASVVPASLAVQDRTEPG